MTSFHVTSIDPPSILATHERSRPIFSANACCEYPRLKRALRSCFPMSTDPQLAVSGIRCQLFP